MSPYDGHYWNVFGEGTCATYCRWERDVSSPSKVYYHDPNISTVTDLGHWTCRTKLQSVSLPPTQSPTPSPTLPPIDNPCPEGFVQRLVCKWNGCTFKCVKPKRVPGGSNEFRDTPSGYFRTWDKLPCKASDQIILSHDDHVLSSATLWTPLWALLVALAFCTFYLQRKKRRRAAAACYTKRLQDEENPENELRLEDSRDSNKTIETREGKKPISMEFENSAPPSDKNSIWRQTTCPSSSHLKVCCICFGVAFYIFVSFIVWFSWLESLGVAIPSRMFIFTPLCSARYICANAKSFRNEPVDAATLTTDPFSLIIASDSQVTWYNGEYEVGSNKRPSFCSDDESYKSCNKKVAKKTNEEQVAAFASLSSNQDWILSSVSPPPRGLIMNGDLTAYFHKDQLALYESMFHSLPESIENYYPSLGNHDYKNNLGGATYNFDTWMIDENCNAEHGVAYMRAGLGCDAIPKLRKSELTSFDLASMGYSFERGRYHFSIVNYSPTYTSGVIGIRSSMAWLTRDLKDAYARGMRSVIVTHSATEFTDDFRNLANATGVVAIFAGHLHRCVGKSCAWPVRTSLNNGNLTRNCSKNSERAFEYTYSGSTSFFFDHNGSYKCRKADVSKSAIVQVAGGNQIPVFWSGSSTFQTFMVAAFNDTGIFIEAMSSKDGVARPLTSVHSLPGVVYPYTTPEDVSGIFVPTSN